MTYLSRDGQSQGPFTDEQIRSMQESGEILKFQWIWKQGAASWQAIAPPPPPAPTTPVQAESPRAETSQVARAPEPSEAPRKAAQVQTFDRKIEAVCHDRHQVVSGILERMTDEGCDLISEDEHGPAFSKRTLLLLSLVDTESGKSMNVHARLTQAQRRDGRWSYRLHWDECPALLAG